MPVLPYAAILALALLAHARALGFDFVYMDDAAIILDNELFLKNPYNLLKAFTQSLWQNTHLPDAYYRPLYSATFFVDYQLSGLSPWAYHLSNLIYHALAAGLLYELLRRFLGRKDLALWGAAAFAIHPLTVPAVAWVPARDEPMLAIFLFGALIALWDALPDPPAGRRHFPATRCFHPLLFFLALLCKETAIVIPVLGAALARFRGVTWPEIGRRLVPGWTAALVVYFVLRRIAIEESSPIGIAALIDSAGIGLAQLPVYLGKAALPWNLSPLPVFNLADFLTAGVVLAAITAAWLIPRPTARFWPLFGLGWFALFLLPTALRSNPSWTDFVLREDRGYLPLVGLILALLGTERFQKLWSRSSGVPYGAAAVLAVFCLKSLAYAGAFSDKMSYWKSAAEGSPGLATAHLHFADMYLRENDMPRALEEYRKTIELNPTEGPLHNNLGVLYLRTGELEKARAEFLRALDLYPRYATAALNLGLVSRQLQRPEEAEKWFRRTIELNPDNIEAYQQIVLLYLEQSRPRDARPLVEELMRKGVDIS